MFGDIFLGIVSIMISIFSTILGGVGVVVPSTWQMALDTFFGYAGYLQGWLPIYPNPSAAGLWHYLGLFNIMGYAITILVAWYIVKSVVQVFRMIPFFSNFPDFPTIRR